MKNAPFYLLVGIVAIILGLIITGIFFSLTEGSLPENAFGAFCTVLILVIAIIGYEVLMKPGFYFGRREREEEVEEEKKEDESSQT